MAEPENLTTKADVKKLTAHLRDLTAAVTKHLRELDDALTLDRSVPGDVGQHLARIANDLDLANDRARYFGLGVDYRTDKKGAPHSV